MNRPNILEPIGIVKILNPEFLGPVLFKIHIFLKKLRAPPHLPAEVVIRKVSEVA